MSRPVLKIVAAFLAGGVAMSGVLIAQAGDSNPGHYTVDPADTWQSIAAAHDLTADALQLANNLAASTSNTAHPRTGWVLHVPEVPPSTTTTTTTTTLPPETTTTQPDTTTTATPTTTTTTTAPPATTTTTVPATTTTTQPPAGGDFLATFETPDDFYDRFQLDAHFRNEYIHDGSVVWGRVFPGDHDMACGAPTTSRDVHLHPSIDGGTHGPAEDERLEDSELFWWCAPGGEASKGHVMTGMADVDGYTILSFSPHQPFTNIRRVCWDVNSTDLGLRKWIQAAVVPEAAYQASGQRLDYISPVTQDVDGAALPLPQGSFLFQMWDHTMRSAYNGVDQGEHGFGWSTSDKAARYQHCMVDNENGTVTLSQKYGDPAAPSTKTATVPGSFPAGQARVIFQDDNYTPEKDGPLAGFTWHWDNVTVDVH